MVGDGGWPRGDSIVSDIVEALEASGVDRDAYTLYDYLDVDALDRLLVSADSDIEVRLSIVDVPLTVTPTRITVGGDGDR